jgi:phosphatidyl-myo-inositol dimannoside synthase
MKTANIFMAGESFSAGNGGICRVARLMTRVLAEQVQTGRLCGDALALSDVSMPSGLGLPLALAKGHRARFFWKAHRAAFNHSHFIYDFVGMARAHCRVPFLRRPFLTWIHGIEVWENTRPDRLAWARRADVLLSNSAYTRDRAGRLHGGFANAKVCWLATETDEPPPVPLVVSGPPTVLMMGRFDAGGGYKGHQELVECWPRVVAAVSDARLLFVGSGPGIAVIQQLAAQSIARARIEFRGFVPEEELESVWAQTSVFAMPSRGEGFGLVYIEAMRHSLPVVASVHDAAPEINLDGVTGFNVNLDQSDEVAERLIFLLKNPALAATLGRAGRERWREHFRYSCFRERFLPVLQEFLDNVETKDLSAS